MNSRMSDKILDRLNRKFAKETPYRGDFVLADFKVLDNDRKTAEVLITYDNKLFGQPSKEMVAQTLTEMYKSSEGRPQLMVEMNSMKYYPEHQAVACVVSCPTLRRPIEDVKKYHMKPICGSTMFIDQNMEDTWRVSKSEGGVFIERLQEEDIDTILRERGKGRAFRTHACTSLTLNRVAASVSDINYSVGDRVKCAFKGKVREGEIVGVSTSGAQIRFANGEQATVATAGLYGLVQAAEKSVKMSREALKDYYRKAYGYSEEDLEKLVKYID